MQTERKCITKGKYGVLLLHTSVHVHLDYKPNSRQTGCSSKPNACFLAVMHLDPMGQLQKWIVSCKVYME